MNERIQRIRDRAFRCRRVNNEQEAALREESHRHTEGEPEMLREARAIAHCFRNEDIVIRKDELIVGCRPGLVEEDEPVQPHVFNPQSFEPPEWWNIPQGAVPFWHHGMLAPAGNHTTLDYRIIFSEGVDGLLRRVAERAERLDPDDPNYEENRIFLQSLDIVGQSYLDWCRRHADLAQSMAEEETAPVRRQELHTIAQNCRRVPAGPPQTFWEACQCAWFAFMLLPDAPGRVDQYLYPAYAREAEAGTLAREFAVELLSCLWIKYFEARGAQAGVGAINHLTLGGTTPEGEDACNEVTELCLEVTEDVALRRPQVGLRCGRTTPARVLERAVRALRSNSGNPDFCNDDVIVESLVGIGVRPEDARDFSLSGCHEIIVTGKAQMGSVEGFVNLPKTLRMALGLEPDLAPSLKPAPIESYDELWNRLEQAMEIVARAVHQSSMGRDSTAASWAGGDPTSSLVVRDCIENCRDYRRGGARYNFCNWNVIGLANMADSLSALTELVFKKETVGLAELVAALRDDWQGHDELRHRVMSSTPHFGNEEPEVDALASRVIRMFSDILARHTPFRGGRYILGTLAGGENMHVEFGRMTGATPDGRRSGETFADSIGAAQGRDLNGVTALLNSVARLPHNLLPTAVSLNVKLPPSWLETDEGIARVAALIRGHFRSGGQQMQLNLVDRETLLQARENPEMYPELMVRVAGYCAPFTSLWPELQEEIIARTEHQA